MKKKIAIWCCLAVVLAIFTYYLIENIIALAKFLEFYGDTLKQVILADERIYDSYIGSILFVVFSIIGIILISVIAIITYCFKDCTFDDIKKQQNEKQLLREVFKKEQKRKKIEKLNKEIEKLKED